MHIPAYHGEHDSATLESFIKTNPLGQLTTAIPLAGQETIQVSHIPWVLTPSSDGSAAKLRGHVARANPQIKSILASLEKTVGGRTGTLEDNVLILFNAPVHSYVPPRFYQATKPTTGKTVPTWDYAAVQVYGKLTCYGSNDDESLSFLTTLLDDLTLESETKAAKQDKTDTLWTTDEAPESYRNMLKKAIVGVEIEVEHMEGRFKLSQEMKGADHSGVVEGYRARGTAEGDEMARMVEERGKLRDEKAAAKAAA